MVCVGHVREEDRSTAVRQTSGSLWLPVPGDEGDEDLCSRRLASFFPVRLTTVSDEVTSYQKSELHSAAILFYFCISHIWGGGPKIPWLYGY